MQPTEYIPAPTRAGGTPRPGGLVSKVPAVTATFWVLKILTTGMGEAASDALVRWGGIVAVAVTGLALAASFVVQFRAERYVPVVYWLAVAMVGVFGTMAADIPHFLGIPLWITSAGYLLAVLAIFAVWYRLEGTLSFASITRGRREAFYWAAVVATFALGTAVGDLTADSWHLGNLVSGFLFCGLIALPVLARRWFGLNYVAAFWTAYVLTRPLGASFADWMGGPTFRGGLGVPTALVAVLWGLAILGVAAYVADHRPDAGPTGWTIPSQPDDREHRLRSRPTVTGAGGRVVVVSASVGGGHDGAARELAQRLRAAGRTVDLVDALDLLPGRLGHLLCRLYRLQLTVAPRSWGWLLAALDTRALTALASGVARLAVRRLEATPRRGCGAGGVDLPDGHPRPRALPGPRAPPRPAGGAPHRPLRPPPVDQPARRADRGTDRRRSPPGPPARSRTDSRGTPAGRDGVPTGDRAGRAGAASGGLPPADPTPTRPGRGRLVGCRGHRADRDRHRHDRSGHAGGRLRPQRGATCPARRSPAIPMSWAGSTTCPS